MLLTTLKERKNVVLEERTYIKYVLYACTEEETELFYDAVQLFRQGKKEETKDFDFLNKIYCFGHKKDFGNNDFKKIISPKKIHEEKRHGYNGNIIIEEVCSEHPCYQKHKNANMYNNIIIHEDALSSFRCACEIIQSDYFIVLKEFLNGNNNS